MLAYAHIKLLSMLSRFEPEEVVRVATDSINIGKSALKNFEGVEAYKPHLMHPKGYCRICTTCPDEATPRPPRDGSAPDQWRDKGEQFYMPMEHAAYLAKPEYIKNIKDLAPNTAPCHDDPLSRHRLVLSERRWGQRQNHAIHQALPHQKPSRLYPDSSPGQRDAGGGGGGASRQSPDLSQFFPLEWPDRLERRVTSSFPA